MAYLLNLNNNGILVTLLLMIIKCKQLAGSLYHIVAISSTRRKVAPGTVHYKNKKS